MVADASVIKGFAKLVSSQALISAAVEGQSVSHQKQLQMFRCGGWTLCAAAETCDVRRLLSSGFAVQCAARLASRLIALLMPCSCCCSAALAASAAAEQVTWCVRWALP
jgi:hypothetical protein